jgi:glycosyltransferase involved in cell wall biosynthesis
LVIPFHRYTPVRVFNKTVLCWQLRKKARQLGLENPIVITACPSTAYVIRALDAKARIYYCADEHSALAGMDAELVQKLENELLTKVDLVVVSSKALEAAKGKLHPKVRYLPHGVDLNVFSPAANGSLKRPNDMAGFSQPIVGFVGSMGAHIDFELVQYAAEQLPGVTFVMVGPVEPDTTPPGGMPNLRFLGPKSHDEVPQYLAHFDVCIIPWRQTTRNRYASPTKLREYLAAGCSVVTTPHGETMVAEGPILYAETKESFAEMIARALDGEIGMSRKEISALMRKHTWRRRAGALLTTIEECTTAQAEQPTGLPWQTS